MRRLCGVQNRNSEINLGMQENHDAYLTNKEIVRVLKDKSKQLAVAFDLQKVLITTTSENRIRKVLRKSFLSKNKDLNTVSSVL